MASAAAAVARSTEAEKNFECPVCFEIFRDPKVLSCGHTICRACILKATSGSGSSNVITCPICKENTDGPPERLRTNFALLNIIESLPKQPTVYACSECTTEFSVGQLSKCVTCNTSVVLVCSPCLHQKHRDHETQGLVKLLQECRSQLHTCFREVSKDVIIQCDHQKILTRLKSYGVMGSRIELALGKLKKEWDSLTNEIQGANVEQLVTAGQFEKFLEGCKSRRTKIVSNKDKLLESVPAIYSLMSSIETTVRETVPEVAYYVDDGDKYKTEATFRFKAEKLSALAVESAIRGPFKTAIRGLLWRISVRHKTGTKGQSTLGLYVQCKPKAEATSWSCNATWIIRLLPQTDGLNAISKAATTPDTFSNASAISSNWGNPSFCNWNYVLDPRNGYIKDDSIIIEATVSAEEPSIVYK